MILYLVWSKRATSIEKISTSTIMNTRNMWSQSLSIPPAIWPLSNIDGQSSKTT